MIARLRAAFELRPGEAAAVAWAAAMFAAILTGYSVLKPVRDAFALDGDPAFIPWLFTATFLAMTAIAPPWGALVARLPRDRTLPIVYRAFVAQLVVLAALVYYRVAPAWVGKVFYVWLSVFNLFVVSVFWSLCADVIRPEQGRRLFGVIAAGGTVGTLLGPSLTRGLVAYLDPGALLVVSAIFLEAAVWCGRALDRAGRRMHGDRAALAPEPPALGGGAVAGLLRTARSPYLAGIAGYVLCASCLATFIYLKQAGIAKAALPDRAARTAYFAEVELWTGLVTLALQVLVTSRLLRWFGVGVVLAVLPLVQGAGVLLLAATPTLTMAIAVSSSGRAVTHALTRPGRELLFTAVDREDKYKSKNVIDTLVYRFGDFGSSWLHRGLTNLGVAIAAVAVPLVAAWAVLALALGLGHRRRSRP